MTDLFQEVMRHLAWNLKCRQWNMYIVHESVPIVKVHNTTALLHVSVHMCIYNVVYACIHVYTCTENQGGEHAMLHILDSLIVSLLGDVCTCTLYTYCTLHSLSCTGKMMKLLIKKAKPNDPKMLKASPKNAAMNVWSS